MKSVDRRSFHQLTMAALGGMVAGTTLGAGSLFAEDEKKKGKKNKGEGRLAEVHVCRGLNSCKQHDIFAKNDCAGMGVCATAAYHECKGHNACKGQGGCGQTAGENKCKGMGKCAVPLSDKAWKGARARFEKSMKDANKEFGMAPAANKTPQGNEEMREKVAAKRKKN